MAMARCLPMMPLLVALLTAMDSTAAQSGQGVQYTSRTTPVSPVVPGADRLLGEFAPLVRGKRVALVANHSARLADGTHLADALHRAPGVTLRVLFGMEFDIRSNDYAGARDPESTIDRVTGVPKHNLYGTHHKPTPEQLAGVEVIVLDIQEVGARFYEHINILGFVMEAAAELGQRVVVLDRPNPITGRHPDGFVTDPDRRFRFGSYAPVPVVHGMTMGELARFYNDQRLLAGGRQADLVVVPMLGWTRGLWYDQTGLGWRKPSPNLLSLSSLLAYVGTCLFEAVNVSEGRGTDTPFEVIGAPWLDHAGVAADLSALGLAGVRFDTTTVVPVQQPFHGRPPELAGERLPAVRLVVTDRDALRPYRVGVAMLWAVHRRHADRLVWNDAVLDRLVATPRLKAALMAGEHPSQIFASWAGEVSAFEAAARPSLLYP